jgi:hypothetical protein
MVVNPGDPAEFFVVFGKCLQSILYTGKHQGIDLSLIFPGKVPELFGEGKGDQIILGWQPLAQLILDPLLIFMVLAMGTAPVTAGMRDIGELSAVVIGALCQHVRAHALAGIVPWHAGPLYGLAGHSFCICPEIGP